MSTHKAFDKICCVAIAAALILTVIFMNAESLGIQETPSSIGYETKLFDSTTVHTIDIIMDNWEEFTQNCKSEEYYPCSLVIDNEAYKNVAIRGKGNTSLTQVESYGNDRYSFKIEFDRYDSSKTYYGLDKLCLNNIIQDNTYMKDYICYQMMAKVGVASPLCSYVYITVNGKDWGLYLAVEGIEEAFLQRNYSSDYGELYKPDSQNMGGGRGNGMQFDFDNFSDFGNASDLKTATENTAQSTESSETISQATPQMPDNMPSAMPDGVQIGNPPEMPNDKQNGAVPDMPDGMQDGAIPDMPDGMQDGAVPDMPDGMQDGAVPDMPDGMQVESPPDIENFHGNMTPTENRNETNSSSSNNSDQTVQGENRHDSDSRFSDGFKADKGNMSGSNDSVLLKYIDDNIESYSDIFDNAKTNASNNDKKRLIAALKKLSNGEDIENTVDIDKVIRYFTVHNFVLNFDSYTGSMIHNYYLYEKDGQMQMIPWDYNLAFGGFVSSESAEKLINYPIDSPVSGGNTEDRPMIAWIFGSEEYTELYHQYFSQFISECFDSGYFEETVSSVKEMISPYVEKDPTKFCTYDEFEKGIDTLKEFCLLRAESVRCQLDGTIGSTSDTQKSDSFISAENISISDMGAMNNGFDGKEKSQNNTNNKNIPSDSKENTNNSKSASEIQNSENIPSNSVSSSSVPERKNGNGDKSDPANSDKKNINVNALSQAVPIVVSVVFLAVGMIFAFSFKRRR